MIIASALALHIDLSIKPEVDKSLLERNKFEYRWWEDPYSSPVAKGKDSDDEEILFRMLLETIEKESRRPPDTKGTFRSTMDPWLD